MASQKYKPPYGSGDPNASYQNGDVVLGTPGSIADARVWEWTQREIINAIIALGGTPDGDLMNQLGTLLAGSGGSVPSVLTVNNAPYNLKTYVNTTQRVCTGVGSSPGVQTIAWDAFIYTKKSATSVLTIRGLLHSYSPGSFGSSYYGINAGAQIKRQVALNQTGVNNALSSIDQIFYGLPIGATSISIGMLRNDANNWSTTFNPIDADLGANTPPSTLAIFEVEP